MRNLSKNAYLIKRLYISIGLLAVMFLVLPYSHAQENVDNDVVLIVESNGYIPASYSAAPPITSGSEVLVTAIGQSRSLDYQWSINNRLVKDYSGIGQTTIRHNITGRNVTVSVKIYNDSNIMVSKSSVKIAPKPIELLIYSDHPTRGPLYQSALTDTVLTTAAGLNLTAAPYGTSEENPQVTWSINRNPITQGIQFSVPRFSDNNTSVVQADYQEGIFNQATKIIRIQFSDTIN